MRYDPRALKRLMDERGISESDEITRFCRRLHLNRSTLLEIHAGRSRPRADILGRLARGLGVSVLAFYHDSKQTAKEITI